MTKVAEIHYGNAPKFVRVKVNFFHPHGPSRSFSYPLKPDIILMSSQDILTVVNVATATGRAYALSDEEMIIASKKLSK